VSDELFLVADLNDILQANIDRSILSKNNTILIAKESSL
jgi:hypothetical protein